MTDLAVPDVAFKFEKRKLNLECTLQGVTIRYTTDGSKPTVNSGTVYTGGFVPATDCTVKATAFREGYVESNVTSFDYRKADWTTAKPEFKRDGNQLSLSCASEGASIYYMEGNGTPIGADFQPAANAKLYSTPITLTENTTFSAAAITDNLLTSETASFTVNDFVVAGLGIAFSKKQIHITCEMEDARVRYTTDGSNPGIDNGIEYTSPFLPDTDCTVRAVALRDGYNPSDIASFVYVAEEHTVPRLEIVPLFIERKIVLISDNEYDIAAGDSIIMNGTTILREGDTFRHMEFPTEIFPRYAEFEWKSEELLERGVTGIPIQYATPPSIGYDGERVSIESQEGCYTIVSAIYDNGTQTDDETQGGAIYTLQPETTGQIECLSYADRLFLSDPASLDIHAVRNEDLRTVTLNGAGWMRQAFPAGAPQDWEQIIVMGPETSAPIDNDDLSLLAEMRTLNFIDLKNTAPLPSSAADFSELGELMRLSLPATDANNCTWNLGSIAKLSAMRWNSDTQMASNLYGQAANPNMLLYVDNKALAPDEARNVVCDSHSDLISLTAGHPFCLMDDEITASKASLTKHFDKETSIGTSLGWETIVTPFDVDEITHRHETAGDRRILPFEAIYGDDPTPGFWLATPEANTDTWTDFSRIQRGIPYIIAMPNDNEYLEEYNIRGDVTFTGHDVEIRADLYRTDFIDAEGNIRRFAGSYTGMERSENVFALTETDNASVFAPSESEVLPFECWFDGQPGMSRIAIGNPGAGVGELSDSINGVRVVQTGSALRIETDTDTTVRIVGMTGATIRTVATRGHEPAYIDAPTPGIYIIANRKFIVK